MQAETQTIDFNVQFFTIDDHYELISYGEADSHVKENWNKYYEIINKEILPITFDSKEYKQRKIDHLHGKLIRILFLDTGKLVGNELLDNLARRELITFNHEKAEAFSPLVTIGTFDIMSLYAYPIENETDQELESQMLHSLRFDTRYKFLDSSIWFRYIPIKQLLTQKEEQTAIMPEYLSFTENTFSYRFEVLMRDIYSYWVKGLYFTNAAIATLELQFRLLLQSRIAKIGNGGHAEAVTPFKFHSESFLQNYAQNEKKFFGESWGEDQNGKPISLSSECRFRILVVDDQVFRYLKLSTYNKKYESYTPNKAYLILEKLYEHFVEDNIEVKLPMKETGVVDFCLQELKAQYFDLIFLDYLLGMKTDDSDNREYGYEFLLNIVEDGKKMHSQYKRSFQGRFWIFSISSKLFALPDKLYQLGLSNLQNLWHLSNGGDPITNPHLYNYYLFHFIKQKISTYFLHPELLLSILKENPVHIKKSNEKFWAEYLENTILNWRQRVDLASRHAQDDDSSPFTESIAWFCKKNVPLNKTLDLILKITSLMKEGCIGGSTFFACEMEFESPLLRQYKLVGDYFFKQIKGFQCKYLESQDKRIKYAKRKGVRNINFENLKIYELPQKINSLSNSLNELILSYNHIGSFPQLIFSLKKLSKLHLDHNPISNIVGDIKLLPRLTDLNLTNTPLGAKLTKPHAQNREEVLQLWKEAIDIQKNTSIKKVLYFGLSPENKDKLRVDREFQQIRMALKGERFELIPNFAVNYIDFQREVLKNKAEIIHFSGHGNNQSLVFQESVGSDQKVEFKTVDEFFKNSFVRENLQCILLNACKTKEQAQALSLHQLYAIGMTGSIEDERAIAFSAGFYNAVHLIEDQNFKDAFHMGINAAKNEENNLKKRDTDDSSNLLGDLTVHLYHDGKEIASEVFK